MRVLNADAATERVDRYLDTLIHETEMLAQSCGYDSPDQPQAGDVLLHLEPSRWERFTDISG